MKFLFTTLVLIFKTVYNFANKNLNRIIAYQRGQKITILQRCDIHEGKSNLVFCCILS